MRKPLLIPLALALCGCVSNPPVIYDINADRVVVAADRSDDPEYLEQVHEAGQQGCGVYGHKAVYISSRDGLPGNQSCYTSFKTGYVLCRTRSIGKHHLFACLP